MREIKFDMAYIAKYSPREGTAAAKLKDNVPQKEKERRWKILIEILKKITLEKNKEYLNKTVDVLITEQKNGYLFGQTKNFKNIKILDSRFKISNSNLIGKFLKVKIVKAIPWGLEGKLLLSTS
jgi:tRNA-2-methylthio-N6-dimethylallyladenosine synthase